MADDFNSEWLETTLNGELKRRDDKLFASQECQLNF